MPGNSNYKRKTASRNLVSRKNSLCIYRLILTHFQVYLIGWFIYLTSKNQIYFLYTQYPIIRNGDQRWALEFLKNYQFPDADRFLILQGWALAVS